MGFGGFRNHHSITPLLQLFVRPPLPLTDLVEKILLGAIRFVTEFFRGALAQQLQTLNLARRFGELLSFHRPCFFHGN